jgi:hypothetical protein
MESNFRAAYRITVIRGYFGLTKNEQSCDSWVTGADACGLRISRRTTVEMEKKIVS